MSMYITHHDENRPEECEHLWLLANSFSLCLNHPDKSHNAEIQRELLKVRNILNSETAENSVPSADIIFSLRQKGVWLDSDCGRLHYAVSDTTKGQGNWELVTTESPGIPQSELIDMAKPPIISEDLLIEVMNDILKEMTSQSIIFYTFNEIESTWRERSVRKNQRRIVQQVKDSKVQTLGEASKIVVGDQVKTLTTAVDIQLLENIMTGLDTPLELPENSSSFSSCPASPTLFSSHTHSVSDLPPVSVLSKTTSRARRGSVRSKSSVNSALSNSFDTVLAKQDKIISTVALALNGDGVFQNMLREGVRVLVHYRSDKPTARGPRRVQRLMRWKTKRISICEDDMLTVNSTSSQYEKVINKLEFYKIDVGVVDEEPEHSIIIDDVVEIYNGVFTEVFQASMQHLHGIETDEEHPHHRQHHRERMEHEKRCFSMVGCHSYFDNRNCVDLEIIPRNKQFIKVTSHFTNDIDTVPALNVCCFLLL